jgi:hypothetical protein
MVEAALVLPLLLLFLVGIADVGRAFTTSLALANAAREGARHCALHPGDSAGTRARAAAELGDHVVADVAAVTCPTAPRGQPVTVAVAATFTPLTPYVSTLAGGPIRIEAPATMVVW